MIKLYNKDFTTEYGYINSICEASVEEERNGLFELSFIMLNTDKLFSYIKEDNVVVANANDTLLNQKFRIYMTRKLMNNRIEVFARHISFDLMYDYIDNISFSNQSCEYALNQLFRSSNFSKHYKGYSDIINAQDYNVSMANVLEAIGGKSGSIIDVFGTGAEILRDNENIHILNKRGHDNSVTIEYKKNLTGIELEEDTTELITRILPYAKYTPADSEEEVIVKANYVDSPLIGNYSHPFISAIDYSEKFKDGEEVTTSKLIKFAQDEFKINKVDLPKQNFKIDFISLSKCVGYEALEDKISLCDTVTIIDTRYNVNTQAKVIKTVFNVLKNRYESMELGDPKTSLADIVGNGGNEAIVGPPGPQGPPGADGEAGDFPDTLPHVPIVETKVYGFSNIEISWTFENKVYYQYEVYASKEEDFTPNTFNLIHQGQTSTYMYQAKPNEIWHFKVCALNSHGNRTDFGSASATTVKIEDLSNYVEEMAIDDALIGTLNLGRGWFGELKGNYIDAKQLSVTDGNGKRTLDIDSFGNVYIDAKDVKMNGNTIDLNGKVSFSDLYTPGRTDIHGGNVRADSLSINSLKSNNENPIIKLFEHSDVNGNPAYCSIDATAYNESGQGNAIRFKWDSHNYILQKRNGIDFYLDPRESGNAFGFNSDYGEYSSNYESRIYTKDGTLCFRRSSDSDANSSNLYFYTSSSNAHRKILTTYDINTAIDYNSSTHVASSSAVKKLNDKVNNVSSTANSAYSTANSANSTASNKLDRYSTNHFESGSHDPYYNDSYNLGWSSYRWQQVACKYVYATNTYAAAIDNPVATINDNSIDDVLDDIIIESPNIMRMTNGLNEKLVINVNALKGNKNAHLFVSEDDGGNTVVNESSLLALALLEIQKLKQEIKAIKK